MAVLPKFLYGTYKRCVMGNVQHLTSNLDWHSLHSYKADTATYLDWLIETAKKWGHQVALQQPSGPSKEQSGKKIDNLARAYEIQISLKELDAAARAVASSGLEVPSLIIAAAKRAIALRKRCRRWYSGRKDHADEPDFHSYFSACTSDASRSFV